MGLAGDFVLILVAGLAGGILARALRLPLLVGYIVAGVFVGPHTAGPTVVQIHDIETLAEIGVALLLFSLGIEVSFRNLRVVRLISLVGTPLQLLLTITAAGTAAVWLLGFSRTEAIWFGAMVSVSSTMVTLKLVAAGGFTTTLASRVMIGMLLVQDLAVIPMLIVLPQLGKPDLTVSHVASALALAAGCLLAVYFGGTWLLPPLLRRILSWGSQELFLVAVVATGVGVGAAMHALGFSFALGAFVAGLMLSESEFSHQALSDVVPLRDIFGLLFFVTVGMLFDPSYVLNNPERVAIVVASILLGKALLIGLLARAFGYRYLAPWVVGLGLAQIGEFSFVLARAGYSAKLLSQPVYDLALTATVATLALSPLMAAVARPLGRFFGRGKTPLEPPEPQPTSGLTGHVVVGGYGRTGRTVARALRRAGIPCFVVEANFSLVAGMRQDGFDGVWGDVSSAEILHAAHIEKASMLVLTMPNQHAAELAAERGRLANTGLALVVRSTKSEDLERLQARGIAAVQTEFEGGLEMIRQALLHYGREGDDVWQTVDESRQEIYRERS